MAGKISGEMPDEQDQRHDFPFQSSDLLAVNALDQLREHPRVAALRNFILGWHVPYLPSDMRMGNRGRSHRRN